jgi:hypothetical protein
MLPNSKPGYVILIIWPSFHFISNKSFDVKKLNCCAIKRLSEKKNKKWTVSIGIMPFRQLAISSTCHFVNLPFCQLAILSPCHFVNFPFCQLAILSTFHFVNLPFRQLAILTICHFVNSPFCQLAILSTSHFVNLPSCQLAILSDIIRKPN